MLIKFFWNTLLHKAHKAVHDP